MLSVEHSRQVALYTLMKSTDQGLLANVRDEFVTQIKPPQAMTNGLLQVRNRLVSYMEEPSLMQVLDKGGRLELNLPPANPSKETCKFCPVKTACGNIHSNCLGTGSASTFQNVIEAFLVDLLLDALLKGRTSQSDIAVISPYRVQVKLLQRVFRSHPYIDINTVDQYQGRDKPVVILSCSQSSVVNETSEVLNDDQRLAVAITRSRHKLIIIGNISELIGKFNQYYQMSRGNYHISVTEILESERKIQAKSMLKIQPYNEGEFSIKDLCLEDDKERDHKELNGTESDILAVCPNLYDEVDKLHKGVCIVKPIVYGNIARYFGKKREEDGHTHQWTVYVKPYHNEDMSAYVKKVHFKLHESYADPNRIIMKPPYEVTETGWGEFEIVIKIYFHDPNERPTVTLYHILKLFQSGPDAIQARKTLISEFYEEIVFQDPTNLMHHMLTSTSQLSHGTWKHDTDFEEKKEKTIQNIMNAKNKIRHEISDLKDRLKLAKDTISKFKSEITKFQSGGVI
uniref:YEATS domain-containing protein 4 n=1 Tax=Timema bartmani TaxID=61472 RepID=A0A7R9I7I5_9NEOP|nr:unnamed protein product [Timema bartmani]